MFENKKVSRHLKKLYAAGIVLPWVFIGIAYFYFQKELGLAPCPLCMFQRAALAGISIVCLFAFFLSLRANAGVVLQKVSAGLVALLAVVGVSIAGRQVWLQHLPPEQVPACGVDPVYQWLESSDYGFMEMIATTLQGSGDCSVVDWSFLGLSIAGWMIVIFSAILLLAITLFVRAR